jgi:hypothetical protein
MNLPAPVGTIEGASMVITNLHACASVIGCTIHRLACYIAWRTGARVAVYPDYVAVYAHLDPSAPQSLVASFMETCVRCPTCKSLKCTTPTTCPPRDDPIPSQVEGTVIEVLD